MTTRKRVALALFLALLVGACGGASAAPSDPPASDPPAEDSPAEAPPKAPTLPTLPTIEDGKTPLRVVAATPETLAQAIRDARPGDQIGLEPGTYEGRIWIEGLRGTKEAPIWIGGAPESPKPVIEGGTEGLHLTRCRYLILHDLEVKAATLNGINCDDGGDRTDKDAASDLLFRDLHVHDIGTGGNHDGLKLSGLDRYVVRGCVFERVRAGSGIDHVGCHDGVIEACKFQTMGSNAIQAKGGTTDLLITRCTFDDAGQRGVNIGGSTGFAYFRPPLSETEPNAEARRIRVVANVFGACVTPFAFVGAVDCEASNNTVKGTTHRWLFRILQETTGDETYTFLPCQRCTVRNTLFHFSRANLSTFVNVGTNTDAATFTFEHNLYYAPDDPEHSAPTNLPAPESNGVYGKDPLETPSPAVGAGKTLAAPTLDVDGRLFRDPPSIGAYARP